MKKNKELRIKKLVDAVKKNKITAYEIGQNTSYSATAIQNIIDGVTTSPRDNTLEEIETYISSLSKNKEVFISDFNFSNENKAEYYHKLEQEIIRNKDEMLERPFLKSVINERAFDKAMLAFPEMIQRYRKLWEEEQKNKNK